MSTLVRAMCRTGDNGWCTVHEGNGKIGLGIGGLRYPIVGILYSGAQDLM